MARKPKPSECLQLLNARPALSRALDSLEDARRLVRDGKQTAKFEMSMLSADIERLTILHSLCWMLAEGTEEKQGHDTHD